MYPSRNSRCSKSSAWSIARPRKSATWGAFSQKGLDAGGGGEASLVRHQLEFSEPFERGDDSLDYIPTQIVTETFKLNGFDGIAYESSYGEDGFNVALFDVSAANVISCNLYRINDVSVKFSDSATRISSTNNYPAHAVTSSPPAPGPAGIGVRPAQEDCNSIRQPPCCSATAK